MSQIKFKLKDYLDKLNEEERNELIPYIKGVLTIGLLIPTLTWIIFNISDLLLDKLSNRKPQTNVYASIGFCYTNHDCRHNILDNPSADTNLENLSLKIHDFLEANTAKANEKKE